MTSIFCAISYIKNVSGSSKSVAENTPLKLQTLEDYPSMYDLPISPPFGIFTASVQDPSTPEGDNAAFRLKRESYDGVTASQVTMSVLCKYNPKGRHANVADATKCQSIISVAGNSKTADSKSIKDRKSRNEQLEQLAEKFSPPPNKKQPRNVPDKITEDLQEESSSRAKRLKLAVGQINENKGDESAEVQPNAVDLTRLDKNSTEHLNTRVETDTDGLYSDEEQPDNSEDVNTP
ncbi:5025_t:CDS:2 [Racocetra fulgida]|uniref:5025_t:CDS:1 n=1 Tax=Racocetra fulgida TaxID=60492 RepID=A0A9N9AJJ4_9GLOM|nr:5025_t:CDS:2 [Racocetra fulgida]